MRLASSMWDSAARVLMLASFEGAVGCLAVLEGNEPGFADIDLACQYNYWVSTC